MERPLLSTILHQPTLIDVLKMWMHGPTSLILSSLLYHYRIVVSIINNKHYNEGGVHDDGSGFLPSCCVACECAMRQQSPALR